MRKRVGKYVIQQPNRPLGHGQSAVVYLATHIDAPQEVVALKFFHLFAPEKGVQRIFLRETQIITRLDHPNIIRVLHVGFDRNNPYYVMSYAPGGNLRSKVARGSRLSPKEVDVYLQQIAIAIQHVHDNGLVHCDLKPENILIAADGALLLADFGITRSIQTIQAQSTQAAAGTPVYMAPEQFMGKPDMASDQYALGVLVYELLSGSPPFIGNSAIELIEPHLHEAPPSLAAKNPAVSRYLESVIFRALEKKMVDRFPTVLDFAQAFHDAIQEPVKASLSLPLVAYGGEGEDVGDYYNFYILSIGLRNGFVSMLYDDLSREMKISTPRTSSSVEYGGSVSEVRSSWFGPGRMKPSDSAFEESRRGIFQHEKFLPILSVSSLEDDSMSSLIEYTRNLEVSQQRDILLPLCIDESIMRTKKDWVRSLRNDYFMGDFTGWKNPVNYRESLSCLLLGLRKPMQKAPLPSQPSVPFYSCMIAYSGSDVSIAAELYRSLRSRGVQCWFAPVDLRIGDKLPSAIESAAHYYDKMLLLLSETSKDSPWLETEVAAVLKREETEHRQIIMAFLLGDTNKLLHRLTWVRRIFANQQFVELFGRPGEEGNDALLNSALSYLRKDELAPFS